MAKSRRFNQKSPSKVPVQGKDGASAEISQSHRKRLAGAAHTDLNVEWPAENEALAEDHKAFRHQLSLLMPEMERIYIEMARHATGDGALDLDNDPGIPVALKDSEAIIMDRLTEAYKETGMDLLECYELVEKTSQALAESAGELRKDPKALYAKPGTHISNHFN